MKILTAIAFALLLTTSPATGEAQDVGGAQQSITTSAAAVVTSKTAENTTMTAEQAGQSAVKVVGNVHCPVGCMAVDPVQPASLIVYKGYAVGLCCDRCKRRFLATPDHYLKKALGH